MRIWDIPPRALCRQHLLGEHRELHAVWAVLTQGKSGYSRHPETLRWKRSFVDPPPRQLAILRKKGCACSLSRVRVL
jgi:hypothetical protein